MEAKDIVTMTTAIIGCISGVTGLVIGLIKDRRKPKVLVGLDKIEFSGSDYMINVTVFNLSPNAQLLNSICFSIISDGFTLVADTYSDSSRVILNDNPAKLPAIIPANHNVKMQLGFFRNHPASFPYIQAIVDGETPYIVSVDGEEKKIHISKLCLFMLYGTIELDLLRQNSYPSVIIRNTDKRKSFRARAKESISAKFIKTRIVAKHNPAKRRCMLSLPRVYKKLKHAIRRCIRNLQRT